MNKAEELTGGVPDKIASLKKMIYNNLQIKQTVNKVNSLTIGKIDIEETEGIHGKPEKRKKIIDELRLI